MVTSLGSRAMLSCSRTVTWTRGPRRMSRWLMVRMTAYLLVVGRIISAGMPIRHSPTGCRGFTLGLGSNLGGPQVQQLTQRAETNLVMRSRGSVALVVNRSRLVAPLLHDQHD